MNNNLFEIYFTDNHYDDYTETLAVFEGSAEDAEFYARTLLLDVLREEDIEDIEYVHLKEHALAGTGEVGSIQRGDSHKVIWIRYYVRPNIVTKENIDEGLKSLLNDMSSYWIEEKQLISLMRALRKEN